MWSHVPQNVSALLINKEMNVILWYVIFLYRKQKTHKIKNLPLLIPLCELFVRNYIVYYKMYMLVAYNQG